MKLNNSIYQIVIFSAIISLNMICKPVCGGVPVLKNAKLENGGPVKNG